MHPVRLNVKYDDSIIIELERDSLQIEIFKNSKGKGILSLTLDQGRELVRLINLRLDSMNHEEF